MAAKFDLLRRYGGSIDRLREGLKSDAALKAEVEAELSQLKNIHPERCVVTKEYVAALQRALN